MRESEVSILSGALELSEMQIVHLDQIRRNLYAIIDRGMDDHWLLVAYFAVCQELQKRKDA